MPHQIAPMYLTITSFIKQITVFPMSYSTPNGCILPVRMNNNYYELKNAIPKSNSLFNDKSCIILTMFAKLKLIGPNSIGCTNWFIWDLANYLKVKQYQYNRKYNRQTCSCAAEALISTNEYRKSRLTSFTRQNTAVKYHKLEII